MYPAHAHAPVDRIEDALLNDFLSLCEADYQRMVAAEQEPVQMATVTAAVDANGSPVET